MNRNSAWAVVETEAIGADVTIAEFAVVRPGVTRVTRWSSPACRD